MAALFNLIAGQDVASNATFTNEPVGNDAATEVYVGTPELVARACAAAADAFPVYGRTGRTERAAFLRAIADEIEARGDALTAMGTVETGLPDTRLNGERGRTTGQLRLFADHIEAGDYLDRRYDEALPDRAPLPRPDLRLMQRPIGPVAVFGASNFPLAFSTAGGDTASALAAGCPVVVKGHPGHPGTASIVAEAVVAAVASCGMPTGTFSLVNDGGPGDGGADSRAVGAALVQDPNIRAVGFTGSLAGGRALFDLACARPDPVPFFGELGSVNPVFLMEHAAVDASALGTAWAASLTMGAGQFCTNPGLVVVPVARAEAFGQAAVAAVEDVAPAPMLTSGIATAYGRDLAAIADLEGVTLLRNGAIDGRSGSPAILSVSSTDFLARPELSHEVFGPSGIIVTVADAAEMRDVARSFEGQLTATLHLVDADHDEAAALVPILEERAGRILCNGWPTGVEVADAMMHGGPWPASTHVSGTSVGTLAIRRFLRPIAYQDMPVNLLPNELR